MPGGRVRELAYGLADSGTAVVFVDEERKERILPDLAEIPDLRVMVVTNEEPDPAGGGARPPPVTPTAPVARRCHS